MAIRVGINGFGRIGRLVFRILMARPDEFEVVGINDITDTRTAGHAAEIRQHAPPLPRHGRARRRQSDRRTAARFAALKMRDPAELPWGELQADVVVESTGLFTARERKTASRATTRI